MESKTDKLKWNSHEIIAFFNIYETYDSLWNVSSEDYLKRDLKEANFVRLTEELEKEGFGVITVDQLKKKIKSLKDCYRNEINKIKKSMKSAAGADYVFKPKLAWFDAADSIWKPVACGRESSSNMDLSQLTKVPEDSDSIEYSAGNNSIMSSSSSIPKNQTQKANRKSSYSTINPPASVKAYKVGKRAPVQYQKPIDQLKNITEIDHEDEYDLFGKLVATQMRDMPIRNSLILQGKIQNLIIQERLSLLDEYPVSTPLNMPYTMCNNNNTDLS